MCGCHTKHPGISCGGYSCRCHTPQPPIEDDVYVSISFTKVPRIEAQRLIARLVAEAGLTSYSVYINDDPDEEN